MLATGAVDSLNDARDLISTSFPARIFEPKAADHWEEAYSRFCRLSPDCTG